MKFLEYEKAYVKYLKAQEWFESALQEQEKLITQTTLRAIRYDKPVVQSTPDGNVMDEYVIKKEEKRIDKKIARTRKLLEDRLNFLRIKEADLRNSNDHIDKIYVLWRLEGQAPREIAKSLNYSVAQVYRTISTIKKDATK
jgi:hypothetical protein